MYCLPIYCKISFFLCGLLSIFSPGVLGNKKSVLHLGQILSFNVPHLFVHQGDHHGLSINSFFTNAKKKPGPKNFSFFFLDQLFQNYEKPPSFIFSPSKTKILHIVHKKNPFLHYRSVLPGGGYTPWKTERKNVTVIENPISLFAPAISQKAKGTVVACEDILDLNIPAFKNPFTNLIFGFSVTMCLAARNKFFHTSFQGAILRDFLVALKERMQFNSESSFVRLMLKDFNPTLNQSMNPVFGKSSISFKKHMSCKDVLEQGFPSSKNPSINQLAELTILSCWTTEILQTNMQMKSDLFYLKLWTHFLIRNVQAVMDPEKGASFDDYYLKIQKEYLMNRAYRGINM